MHKLISAPLALIMAITIIYFTSMPVLAHDILMMGSSRWFFSSNNIKVELQLFSPPLQQIKEIKEGRFNLDSIEDNELKQLSFQVLQPYVNQKLAIWVNDKKYPINISKITRSGKSLFNIYLNIDNVDFGKETNQIKIDYKLFSEETNGGHANIAYFISSNGNENKSNYTFTSFSPIWEGTTNKSGIILKCSSDGFLTGKDLIPQSSNHSSPTFWESASQFILLGIKHILIGYDHILFLLALIVISLPIKEVLKLITSFTVAHSITLFLASLQIIQLNPRIVEAAIALSICYIAIENIYKKEIKHRWLLAFIFGLIHGFGFASILQDFTVDKSNLISLVLAFNIGVEVGQLLILAALLPVLYLLRMKFKSKSITENVSIAVFIMGFDWFLERAFNFKLPWL